jgi:hypothetical protein
MCARFRGGGTRCACVMAVPIFSFLLNALFLLTLARTGWHNFYPPILLFNTLGGVSGDSSAREGTGPVDVMASVRTEQDVLLSV